MLQWGAFDLRTGASVASLPDLIVDYPLTRTLSAYDTATAHLTVPDGAPPNWLDATTPGASLLACWDTRDAFPQAIQWVGFVTSRARDAKTGVVDLSLVTTEGYLDRRVVAADLTYSSQGQNTIVSDLVTRFAVDGRGALPGIPLAVVVLDGPGAIITQTYRDADNASLYDALQSLSALQGGPEWNIEWAWLADGSGLAATLTVGTRIGKAVTPGFGPDAVFGMPGCVTSAVLTEDYSKDHGANAVLAFSAGTGVAPSPTVYVPDSAGRPAFEFRSQPQTNADSIAQLTSYAQRLAATMGNGATSIALSADRRTAPAYGITWGLGDDIGFVIGGLGDDGKDMVPAFPGGYKGTARVIGVQMDLDTITPVLVVLAS